MVVVIAMALTSIMFMMIVHSHLANERRQCWLWSRWWTIKDPLAMIPIIHIRWASSYHLICLSNFYFFLKNEVDVFFMMMIIEERVTPYLHTLIWSSAWERTVAASAFIPNNDDYYDDKSRELKEVWIIFLVSSSHSLHPLSILSSFTHFRPFLIPIPIPIITILSISSLALLLRISLILLILIRILVLIVIVTLILILPSTFCYPYPLTIRMKMTMAWKKERMGTGIRMKRGQWA